MTLQSSARSFGRAERRLKPIWTSRDSVMLRALSEPIKMCGTIRGNVEILKN